MRSKISPRLRLSVPILDVRIVVDLQGAQSTGSRTRGIGRYSLALARAMVADPRNHEILIALSGLFPDAIEPLRASFKDLVHQDQIVVWQAPAGVAYLDPTGRWRTRTGEVVREAFLANLKPDLLHMSSLFEGLGDDALTSVDALPSVFPTAITLYDLIPLVNRGTYLADKVVEGWYEGKLGHLRRARLWLAISECSRREAIDLLDLPDDWVVNISTAADSMFRPLAIGDDSQQSLRQRYGLTKPFIMYTGGIDRRKNVERLIGAYGQLPTAVRAAHQLTIVCAATNDQMTQLKRLARKNGLTRDELVLTGYVSDEDLVLLYNLCKVFVFPSWHEGFGLPALEAMSCGAAVIGSDTSSVPEVLGRSDALFDPYSESDMAAKLNAVLMDDAFRQQLREHALPQAGKFSWTRTARSALEAMERAHIERERTSGMRVSHAQRRPRLAYVSPLPPERSGIADYSAELLPELARYYDIDVIVNQTAVDNPWIQGNAPVRSAQWFDENAGLFDRVLYHFGNSAFHIHMFELLERHPGTVVLHDFFLSGVLAHMEWVGRAHGVWTRALYSSHGYHAARERSAVTNPSEKAWKDLVEQYPANLEVLQHADGVIVHSEFSRELAAKWYGKECGADWICLPLARQPTFVPTRSEARRCLGLADEHFVVCCFGMMGPTKLNRRLLNAWLGSSLVRNPQCRLVFVGEHEAGEYGASLRRIINGPMTRRSITMTGFVSPDLYQRYLAAADVAVQLRAMSRGESSAAILDCMGHGLPTIINALGAANELPADSVVRLPAGFSDDSLVAALTRLWREPEFRRVLGERARAYTRTHHHPRIVADRYHAAIERFAVSGPRSRAKQLVSAIARVASSNSEEDADWLKLAVCVAQNSTATIIGPRQWFVDVSTLVSRTNRTATTQAKSDVMLAWLNQPPKGFRVEPAYYDVGGTYRYARRFTNRLWDVTTVISPDEPIETQSGDVFVTFDEDSEMVPERRKLHEMMRQRGVRQYYVMPDLQLSNCPGTPSNEGDGSLECTRNVFLTLADGILCTSVGAVEELAAYVDALKPSRHRVLRIGWAPPVLKSTDLSLDATNLAAVILEDSWHVTWHPVTGLAAPATSRAPATHQPPADPDATAVPKAIGAPGGDDVRAPRAAVDLDDFLRLIYGSNIDPMGSVPRTMRNILGKSVVETVSDVRRVTMALDRQKFPCPISVRFSASDVQSELINGVWCSVDRHDIAVSVPGSAAGSWEPHIVACFRRICLPGSIVFDIGANVGYHTLLLAQLIGDDGICYAFEPNSENCRLILLGIKRNGFANVRLMPVALSDQQGWAYFSSHIGSNGGFTTGGGLDVAAYNETVIPVFLLDDLRLPDVDVIKVDVEGAEYKALRGGERLIRRSRPVIVSEFSLEMTSRVSGVAPHQYLDWIVGMDYQIHMLDRASSKIVHTPSIEALLGNWGSNARIEDLLFVPREKIKLIVGD